MNIRAAQPGDLDRLMEIEALTFPPVEAAPRATFAYRIAHFPEWFYVAEEEGKVVALLNGRRTPHDLICDELYEPEGESCGDCFALLCVETDPAWQGRGVAAALIGRMLGDAKARGITCVTLACKDRLVPYYAKFGFVRMGLSQSQHGGAVWNDMKLVFNREYTMKVAFLDRDGTISKDYPDAEWTAIRAPELLDGAAEAMRHLMALGYRIIIVTNQYIIGEGFISLAQYESFTQSLLAELRAEGVSVLDVFHCPHRRDRGCDCCKPKVGMIRAACEKYPQIVLAQSFYAGDSMADMQMAQACGLRFYGINLPCENPIGSLMELKRLRS